MPLLLGLVDLVGSTVMLCVGRNFGIIAAGRALQGMSAAAVWVVGLAILVDTVGHDVWLNGRSIWERQVNAKYSNVAQDKKHRQT
jgi:MFS family permease